MGGPEQSLETSHALSVNLQLWGVQCSPARRAAASCFMCSVLMLLVFIAGSVPA